NARVLDLGSFVQDQGDFLTGDVADHFGQDGQAALQHIKFDGQSRHEFQDFVIGTGGFHQQALFESGCGNLAGNLWVFEVQTGQQTAAFDGCSFHLNGDLGQGILDGVDDLSEVTFFEGVVSPVAAQ